MEVFTDRSIYVVGEPIQFRADHRVDGINKEEPWSTVLYVELVTSSGSVVSQGKMTLSGGMGSGTIHLPSGAITGNYYLKCYTRWMRNFGPESFSYTPLKIINPFNADVVNQPNGDSLGQTITRREYITGTMDCTTTKLIYGRGEEVTMMLSGNLMNRLPPINCCVTVVPDGGIDTARGQLTFNKGTMNPSEFKVDFLPDMKGVSLSGTVVKVSGEAVPISSAKLYFSLLGDKPDYLTTVTDELGRFVISTPHRTGIQELFVAPDPSIAGGAEIRIDQDFDTEKISLTPEKFALSTSDQELATRFALHSQLSAVFNRGAIRKTLPPQVRDSSETLFYGTPKFTILMDDFITLPNLEEVFINLIPDIDITVRRGIKSLRILGPNTAVRFYQPLILIDNIPVFDQQTLLSIHPEKILKIDVINEVYVKGDLLHGGLISIFSRNGDMAGIDLPDHSYFFDFQTIQPSEIIEIPEYKPGDHVPDSRNTLIWLDDVLLKKGSTEEITFKAPQSPGDYVILVRGLAHQGTVVSATASFVVE